MGGNRTEDTRLYSLMHPSSELQMACQAEDSVGGRRKSFPGIPIDQPERLVALDAEKEMLWLSDDRDMPLAVFCDHKTEEVVFARWIHHRHEQANSLTRLVPPSESTENIGKRSQGSAPKRADATKRPELGRTDSASTIEKRSSLGGTRSLNRAHNRRVSFKPEPIIPVAEKLNGNPLAALEGDTAMSARIKAEGDLIRGLPHQRRVSQGMKEAEKQNKNVLGDMEIGENTMLFGLDQPKARMQPDIVFIELHRWAAPYST